MPRERKSLDSALALYPNEDPEITAARMLASRYCREVWSASLIKGFRDPSVMLLGKIAMGVSAYHANNPAPPSMVSGLVRALQKAS